MKVKLLKKLRKAAKKNITAHFLGDSWFEVRVNREYSISAQNYRTSGECIDGLLRERARFINAKLTELKRVRQEKIDSKLKKAMNAQLKNL